MSNKKLVCEVRTITPEFASWLLQFNDINRPISPAAFKDYQDIMLNNKWKLNGETIKVTASGRLLDGQHRLMACVATKKSFDTIYVEVEDETAFDTIDIGKRRSRSDILSIRGEKHTTVLASALPLVYNYYKTGKINAQSRRCSNFDLDEMLNMYPDIREHAAYAGSRKGCDVLYTKAAIATSRYLLSKVNAKDADKFITDILYGEDLSKGEAAFTLRNHMMMLKAKKGSRMVENYYTIPLIFIAWNYFRKNRTCKSLKYTIGVDEFPVPI